MWDFFKNVWQSSAGNKIMLIAGALIMVLAVGGVIYGVFFYHSK